MKILVFCMILINSFIFSSYIYRSHIKLDYLKKDREIIAQKKQEALEKIEEYDTLLKQIDDPFYKEKIARDRLQMKKEGELIYRSIK